MYDHMIMRVCHKHGFSKLVKRVLKMSRHQHRRSLSPSSPWGSQYPQGHRHEQAHNTLNHSETESDPGHRTVGVGDRRGDATDRCRGDGAINTVLGDSGCGEGGKADRGWIVSEYRVDVFLRRFVVSGPVWERPK